MPPELSFVADENFDFAVVRQLRENGLSVWAIAETSFGIADTHVLQIAVERNAILLTEDKDFGELVHRLRMPHCGILLVRLLKIDSVEKTKRIYDTIERRKDELWNSFSVLTNDQLRIRPRQR